VGARQDPPRVDGLLRRRLDRPWIRRDGKLQPASWDEAFELIAERLEGAAAKVAAIAGDLQDVESIYAMKALLGATARRCTNAGRTARCSTRLEPRRLPLQFDHRRHRGRRKAILLVGTNPRWEAPLVNTRIRKAVKAARAVFRSGRRSISPIR
jgi:NADH-quinone oxidoreductase subunit G